MKRQILTIRPIEDDDLEQLEKWLRKERILKWYHDADEWLCEIRERNGAFSFLHHFIVLADDEPIGFCQYYDCFDAQEEWYSVDQANRMFSLDYLIGEEDFLRKGHGKQIVGVMLDGIYKRSPHAEVVAQPDSANIASCKTLLSSGFIFDDDKKYFVHKCSKVMNEAEAKELKDKIMKGCALAFERLLEQKKKNDENLVLYQDGKVVVIKARDLK